MSSADDEPVVGRYVRWGFVSRQCKRCRLVKPADEFPEPWESGRPRPFCNPCTDFIDWATS